MNLFDGFDDAERKNLFSELNAKKINFDSFKLEKSLIN